MQDPRAILEATDHTPELKLHLVNIFDKLMDAVSHDRQDISDNQHAALGATVAQAIVEIASSGERDLNKIYTYALSRASAALSGLRWRN